MKFLDLNGLKVVLQKLLSKVATAFDSLDYRVENLEGNYLSKKDSAASAKKLDTNAGADNKPVYFENGIPVAIGHTIDSDVPENAKFTDTTYTDATTLQHGLMSVDDKKKLDNMPTELNKKLNTSQKGVAGGLAELDQTGRVPSTQLPSFVDDVVEGYYYDSKFYKESTHGTVIDGEAGKIYSDLLSNKIYRWGGTAFTVISETLAIGNTATTAGRGDWTKTAYDHSQTAHAPSNAQANQNAFSKVTVGDTTINSGNATDTLTLTAGTNVTLTPDTSGKKVTIASKDTTYGLVSSSANGLAPKSDGSTNKYLRADGSWQVPPNTDTKYNNFTGASANANGNAGLVPAPNMGDQNKYLKADGSWSTPPDTNTDTKVSQTVTTTTGNYPILLGSAGQTANATQGAYFGKGITANPNTGSISANRFEGKQLTINSSQTWNDVPNDNPTAQIDSLRVRDGRIDIFKREGGDSNIKIPFDQAENIVIQQPVKVEGASVNISNGGLNVRDGITAANLHLRPNIDIAVKDITLGQYSSIHFPNETPGPFILNSNNSYVTISTEGAIKTDSPIQYIAKINSDERLNLSGMEAKLRAGSHDNFDLHDSTGATLNFSNQIFLRAWTDYAADIKLFVNEDLQWRFSCSIQDVDLGDLWFFNKDDIKVFEINQDGSVKLGTQTIGSATNPMYLDNGVPTACTYTLSANVPADAKFTDTHHAAYLYTGVSSTDTANAAASNGSLYLNLVENGTVRNSHKITGSGATSVTSDSSGNITISSTNTVYTHPTTAGNKHIPTGGASGQLLGYSASGTAKWVEGFEAITDTELDNIIAEVFG